MAHYKNRKNIPRSESAPAAKIRGISLIEMLVAMVISLFLMGGIIQVFTQSKTSYKLQEGIARAQENGRIALYFFEKYLRRAGYPMDALPQINGFANDKVAAASFNNTPLETGSSDVLVLQYRAPDIGTFDCAGRFVPGNEFIAMRFYLSAGELKCETADTASGTKQDRTLMEGVSSLQLTYAEDNDGDGIPDGNYRSAAAAIDWANVVAVQVGVSIPVQAADHIYADKGGQDLTFSTTVPIRNQIRK